MTHANPFTTFTIVRHGQTEWNAIGKLQGQMNSNLTPEGQAEAQALGERFEDIHFDHVFSSDLTRAHHTAQLITLERQLAVNTSVLLRERKWGSYEGRSFAEFRQENAHLFEQYAQLSHEEQLAFQFAPDMESDAEIATRMLTFLREAAVTYPGACLLVVSHGGPMTALLRKLQPPAENGSPYGSFANTGYIVLRTDGLEFIIDAIHGLKEHSTAA